MEQNSAGLEVGTATKRFHYARHRSELTLLVLSASKLIDPASSTNQCCIPITCSLFVYHGTFNRAHEHTKQYRLKMVHTTYRVSFPLIWVLFANSVVAADAKIIPPILSILLGDGSAAFVHITSVDSILSDASFMDHPAINGKPDAKIVVSHNFRPGSIGTYSNFQDGLFYSSSVKKWGIYHENTNRMGVGVGYNVYVADDGPNAITHIASAANEGSSPAYTVIDNPIINGKPGAVIVLDTYFNPNGVRNNHTYGLFYNGTNWIIYSESFSEIPENAGFNVILLASASDKVFQHQAIAGNVTDNLTVIDHPSLNGNPNAIFVFTHNWGVDGASSNFSINRHLGVWYNGDNWTIYTEDESSMPVNALFNIFVD